MNDEKDKKQEQLGEGIQIQGNIGPGAAIGKQASVAATNIAGRDVNIGTSIDKIGDAFVKIYAAIDAKQFPTREEEEEVRSTVKDIQAQGEKEEKVNESILRAKLHTLALMSPDILEVVIATLTNPLLGINTVVRKVAQKAKEEFEKK